MTINWDNPNLNFWTGWALGWATGVGHGIMFWIRYSSRVKTTATRL